MVISWSILDGVQPKTHHGWTTFIPRILQETVGKSTLYWGMFVRWNPKNFIFGWGEEQLKISKYCLSARFSKFKCSSIQLNIEEVEIWRISKAKIDIQNVFLGYSFAVINFNTWDSHQKFLQTSAFLNRVKGWFKWSLLNFITPSSQW